MKKTTYFLLTILIILLTTSTILVSTSQSSSVLNLQSEIYIISENNLTIARILPQTKIQDFVKRFNVEASNIKVYDKSGKKQITTGYIGTGMKLKVEGNTNTYEISVIGDLTGDGEIKQIEISQAIKHVVGLEKHQLTGINKISADLDGDGYITQKDVSILIKYVVYGKLEIDELAKPAAPVIEITSGTKGENDWYTSNVVLKVTKPENTTAIIEKITCEITGTVTKPETEMAEGDSISIEQEGIYEIKCYSITAAGEKSVASTQTVKIDKTAPTSGELIGKLKDENGKNYEFGTVANQDVYLLTAGGVDELSGIQEITMQATGANTIKKGTKAPVTLKNDGATNIIISTKDNAGLVTTREYTVVIDKVVKEPGIVITKLNDQNGEIYIQDTWTNQNVYIEIQNGREGVKTTYKVDGANIVEETNETITLTKEGISVITVINEDELGNISKNLITVKIDKTATEKPIIEVSGEKTTEENEWYISDVEVKISEVKQTNGANVKNIYYELRNTKTGGFRSETIESNKTITITQEGVYKLTAYAIDEAGNESEPEVIEIKLDETDPIAGTLNLYLKEQGGQTYTSNSWTNEDVCIELVEGSDELSGHLNSKYEVQEQDDTQIVKITKQGQYEITVTTTDIAGRTSTRTYNINIDKTKPQAPTLKVIQGTKISETIEWYNSDVVLEIEQGVQDEGGSGIGKATYEVSGSEQLAEAEISNHGTISVIQDGIYTVTVYNYDIAGNKSEGTSVIVKTDKTAPQNINMQVTELKGTSFHLTTSAQETASGIVLYQFYLDGELHKEIQTNETTVEFDIENLSSKTHEVMVKVKDLAGNESSSKIDVNMGALSVGDIDYIEFVVNDFTKTNNNIEVTSGAEFIISDTSISDATKYIQVSSSDAQTKGEITGTIRLVRKDGEVVNSFEYYPEDLLFQVGQYSDGSGTTFTHNANINILNTLASNTEEGITNSMNVSLGGKLNSDNMFSVSDQKLTGTKTYTRFIIEAITSNEEKIPFKITSTIM